MSSATIAATVTARGRSPGCERLERGARPASASRCARARVRRGCRTSPAAGPAGRPLRRAGGAAAYGCVAPTCTPSSSRSSLAAASGSAASVIARTTTARRAPASTTAGSVVRVEPADREPRLAHRARRVGDVVEARGRAARLGRRRVHGADRQVVDVRVGVRRVGLGRRVRGAADDPVRADGRARRARASSSSWPTWTPSAPHASTRSGRSLRMNSAPCASAAARNTVAASIRPASSSDLSRSWIRSAPPAQRCVEERARPRVADQVQAGVRHSLAGGHARSVAALRFVHHGSPPNGLRGRHTGRRPSNLIRVMPA